MFKTKKSLGQNFLIDTSIVNRIIKSVDVKDNEKILEVGPGIGYLTKELKSFNSDLTCFEIDLDTKKYLDKLVDDKTKVIYKDFMQVDLNEYYNKDDKIHVIANIPYYITTPIIEKIIDSKLNILDMTLMVQKEVADRLSSKPKSSEYGYITVYLNYYFEVNKLFNVDKSCFNPAPKVDSAIIQLKKKDKVKVNEEVFFKLIKDSFKLKRKNLRNNLKEYDLDKIETILSNHGLSLTARAEELSLDVFIDIANNL
jgi:16S rRNA (adenine1518-N6/adenine1519-N6)-dimethyltransferase